MMMSRGISFGVILVFLVIYSQTYNNVSYKKMFDSFLYYSTTQKNLKDKISGSDDDHKGNSSSSKHHGSPAQETRPPIILKRMTNSTTAKNKAQQQQLDRWNHQNYSKTNRAGNLHTTTTTHIWTNATVSSAVIIIGDEGEEPLDGQKTKSSTNSTANTTRMKPQLLRLDNSNNTKANTDVSSGRRRSITMIVTLSGELGNNLLHLIHAYAIKLDIEDKIPNITIELVGEHQNADKWVKPAKDIQQCFVNLRKFDFSAGRWVQKNDPFIMTKKLQKDWLRRTFIGKYSPYLLEINRENRSHKVIENLKVLLQQQQDEPNNERIHQPITNKNTKKVSLPYLRIDAMGGYEDLVEKYRVQIQQWLTFDNTNPKCCGVLPSGPDEGVFHYRNFGGEYSSLPRAGGFVEVGPKHVAELLEKNLVSQHNITKVIFITRHYPNNPQAADKHIRAIQQSNKLRLRVIPDQTGIQDFCLLLHANHIVATRLSSYAGIAGLLGNQTSVLTYMINTKETRTKKPGLLKSKIWKSKVYANRFKQRNYPNEWRY